MSTKRQKLIDHFKRLDDEWKAKGLNSSTTFEEGFCFGKAKAYREIAEKLSGEEA